MKWMRISSLYVVVVFFFQFVPLPATDFVRLTPENWDRYVPTGKEVDAIYGDYVLRNDKIVAVIAHPNPMRNANLTTVNVGGFVLDLTTVKEPNDQLTCYLPLAGKFRFHSDKKVKISIDGTKSELIDGTGTSIRVAIESSTGPTGERAIIEYRLADGESALGVRHMLFRGNEEITGREFSDGIRADRTFSFSTFQDGELFTATDDWFRQSYGVFFPGGKTTISKKGNKVIDFLGADAKSSRFLIPDSSLVAVKGQMGILAGKNASPVKVLIEDALGRVGNALVEVKTIHPQSPGMATALGKVRTNVDGAAEFLLPNGTYVAEISAMGHPPKTRRFGVLNQREVLLRLKYEMSPPLVKAKITDSHGQAIPCKVAFVGRNGTPDPDFGPDSAANPVKNLYYSHDGEFKLVIPPGEYSVRVTRGNEYDAEFLEVDCHYNRVTFLQTRLKRSVRSPGWVSAEYHSHSTPSGDNTSDQRGRVLNLLAEHVEFAPCTEHQRIDSYLPHLRSLAANRWMATCTGMELTGKPLPINHQNAFPLIHKPRTQDGGGPRVDPDPVAQIERLAYWDNKSEKVVQINHPNLVQMMGDADLDAKVDQGFKKMFEFVDVMEVHPPEKIFQVPDELPTRGNRGNVIFNWMQLLNQGHRIVGVVNTDAHYNFHGSGWIRNYVKSSHDDPSKIDVMEMVENSKKGKIIMTTGPFLEVVLQPVATALPSTADTVGPGDDVGAPGGKVKLSVKIQCANWLDVNRVQVFLNGRPDSNLNFSRRSHPKRFSNGSVKFQEELQIELARDTHIIVATIGEGLQLGAIYGPKQGNRPPCAVSNPIFVDVDGNGFQANGDRLQSPMLYKK
jgi:hypothetical protein